MLLRFGHLQPGKMGANARKPTPMHAPLQCRSGEKNHTVFASTATMPDKYLSDIWCKELGL